MTLLIAFASAGAATMSAEWTYWGGDAGGTRYSKLRQISKRNVSKLRVAWTYGASDVSDGKTLNIRSAFAATPLMVDGVLYVATPFNRLVALDAETGGEKWAFDPKIDRKRSYNLFTTRGVSYWTDGRERRIFLGTIDGRLFAIDARSGRAIEGFGRSGAIDLRENFVPPEFAERGYGITSPPAVWRNLVITGAWASDGEPRGPSGDIRAFDARTGALKWRFGVIDAATWDEASRKDRGGANAWSMLSVDQERGIVYAPLSSAATDLYGGDRKGANLFADSLVALDAATGKRLWHFQTVHHNIWDYDLPAQPVLCEVMKDGRSIPAVAQVTKTGFVFLFDRRDGTPIHPIEERPVPPSEIPGEEAWPTQPHPVRPPPFARQSMRADELTTVTPESRAACAKLMDGAVLGTLFQPIGLRPTILFPGTNGGANWGGASFDPSTRTLYVNSMDVGMVYRMVKRPEGSAIPYRPQGLGSPNSRFWDANLYPCQQPPWGHLTAIDLDKGAFRWRSVLGITPELAAKGLPPTGAPNIGGSIVTAGGLVFIGATNDSRFRAFDKDTGKELWSTTLPASAHATPITFIGKRSGKQFVVVAAGGGNKYNSVYSDSLVAFSLP